ncbi:MAG: ParB N-terminal domain-containing protein [Clostridia bacterium]
MKSSVKNVELTKYDDLFKDDDTRQEEKLERILIVPAEQVFPYTRQPYSVDRPTPDLVRLMDSIERMGISEPLITRPREGGGYEIISGHRRDYCGKAIGMAERPIIVRQYTDEEADILVADYNITRENLLPSEKARAYKLKLDAMKRQGQKQEITSPQNGEKIKANYSVSILAEQVKESATQIQRFIRLNLLVPPLIEAVDKGILKLAPAADFISHLSEKEQTYLAYVMERDEASPSVSQAQRLKQFSEEGKLQEGAIDAIMSEEKPFKPKVVLEQERIKKYFPHSYTPKQMEDVIIKLLEGWQRKRQQEQSR